MLDNETKRRIDTARDILVGKVPDPKSQVEQITIALIYKFMDDMDAEAEELGGTRSFFAGEFEKYSWARLLAPGMGGFETLALYGEAIARMPENPGIPLLFRDIFKNAYLPYRDPETLKSFLKIINDFTYDHSERLGDAFEYLLSVLGSQGDAGQFRTPRHIIDFMVALIAPQKNESILDPACGTAGFLISAYKYVLKNSQLKIKDEENSPSPSPLHHLPPTGGSSLTPDERTRLLHNIKGYDISPDMVRLSLVNMYLHGFSDPHIAEYDTLTSADRWHEYADIIMANPPFMSPKGGIRPHNRFSIHSSRSEVLFVDYIAEHLSPTGRAAVIVPEGVIFQSGTAYKTLRKMLVENYLVGVISLPAGVFNPYSGVKTSILWLDKTLAKKIDSILFVKVDHDGFDLGAQRREIKKNDLPATLQAITTYKISVINGQTFEPDNFPNLTLVNKAKITANGDYNLSGERYKTSTTNVSSYPLVSLSELCEYIRGVTYSKNDEKDKPGLKVLRANNINLSSSSLDLTDIRYIDESVKVKDSQQLRKNDIIICAASGSIDHIGKVAFSENDTDFYVGGFMAILRTTERLLPKFLFSTLNSLQFKNYIGNSTVGANIRNLKSSILDEFQIPLPPLDVQAEIVAEIEGYQKIIDGARQVLEAYRPRIEIDPTWPVVSLGDAPLEIIDGDRGNNYPNGNDFSSDGYCLFLNTKNVRPDGFSFDELMFITKDKDESLRKGKLNRDDVVLTTRGTVGNTAHYDNQVPFDHVRINSGMLIFRPDQNQITSEFLYYFFQSENAQNQFGTISSGSAQPQLPIRDLKFVILPLPDLATQERIVAQIEREQALVKANRELIEIFEQKIKARIARVWGG